MHPSIRFILLFAASYLTMQLGYTGFLYLYQPDIDPVSRATAQFLSLWQKDIELHQREGIDKVQVWKNGRAIYNIKEACNGIGVMISVAAFMLAYKRPLKMYAIGIPVMVLVLFIANQLRLALLLHVQLNHPQQFLLFHEYVFPAIIYGVAFGIMIFWAKK